MFRVGKVLEHLDRNLELTRLNFEFGRATQHSLEAIRLNIARVEQDIEVIANEMWVLWFLIENPSLLGME